jgi:hypothetical protein
MPIQLDTPNPAMDQATLDEVQVNNIKKLRNTINKMGVNQLLLVENKTATNFTATALAIPVNMQGVITVTGGWVDIEFKMPMGQSGAIRLICALLIDGKTKDYINLTSPGFSFTMMLSYHGNLGAGRHTVAINFAVGSGTAVISESESITRLQAWETVIS